MVLHDAADLIAHEFRGRVVRCLVHEDIGVGIQEADAAAFGPFGFVLGFPFLRGDVQRGFGGGREAGDAEGCVVGGQTAFGVLGFVLGLDF